VVSAGAEACLGKGTVQEDGQEEVEQHVVADEDPDDDVEHADGVVRVDAEGQVQQVVPVLARVYRFTAS